SVLRPPHYQKNTTKPKSYQQKQNNDSFRPFWAVLFYSIRTGIHTVYTTITSIITFSYLSDYLTVAKNDT
ncbi:MAG: hypothetical protein IJ269_01510, partial [Bacteroidales bacterium]|nr:hypothetical protein [Bacteroidales bacterium]